MSTQTLRTAVLGASGIGKNHARWLHRHGCEVVAFLGSAPERLETTAETLRHEFPFAGRGYTDLDELLTREQPQAVVVSTPPQFHFQHVAACLQAGAHVLCEKPLVDDLSLTDEELRHQGWELVRLAKERGRLLAMQTQYVALVPDLLRLCKLAGASQLRDFEMEMDTRNPNVIRTAAPCREGRAIWIDLAPHPLSTLLALTGAEAQLEGETAQCDFSQTEARVAFRVRRADGEPITARLRVALKTEGPPARRFALNGHSVGVAGRHNAEGAYRIFLTDDDGDEHERADLVDDTIGAFVRACHGEGLPLADGASGARNLDWCLALLERGG